MPNIDPFKGYDMTGFRYDLMGGVSVAALSIPVGVAYAEIAGLPPESGLYTAILALLAYFVLGGSKQVIIGPDSATVTLFISSVIAVGAGNQASTQQLMMMITVATGLLMFVAGFLRLGFIANFLSKPILLGYLNGVSVLLIVSQLSKLTGIKLDQNEFFLKIYEVFAKIELIHYPTFILGVVSILFLFFVRKISITIPSQLLLLALTALAAELFDLSSMGIVFMQPIQDPYPSFVVPDMGVFFAHYSDIVMAAAAIVFVSFSGEIPVVQAFTKGNRGFDPNKEFFALGLADILIGFFKGYPVSGADSRTAVNVAVGGKTKLVNIVAAVLMLMVILLIPGVFAMIPLVTFGAIIIFAALGMYKKGAGIDLFKSEKREFTVFLVCIAGVLLFGVYQGIVVALVLSFIHLIAMSSKPDEFELAYDSSDGSVKNVYEVSEAVANDEVLIFRFNSALLFYNSNYFSTRLIERAEAKKDLNHIIIDAEPINMIDLTAATELGELMREFEKRGVKVVFARANEKLRAAITGQLAGYPAIADDFYPTVHSALEAVGT